MTEPQIDHLKHQPTQYDAEKNASVYGVEYFADVICDTDPRFTQRPDKSMLALGAGSAAAETALAKKLNITPANITAVDVDPQISNPAITTVREDIARFLPAAISRGERYQIVTALGMDYVISHLDAYSELLTQSAALLEDGYLVLTEPFIELPPKSTWESKGFTRVARGVYRLNKSTT